MLSKKRVRIFFIAGLLFGLMGASYSMTRAPTEPVKMEFVRAAYEKQAGAIVIEWVVPNISEIKDLSRIELLVSQSDKDATFGVMLNQGDRLDPIPPGNFGVIIDPGIEDRSIENVSSAAGIPGRWDEVSPHGTLLKQSTRGVTAGNLGISVWIAPQDWVSAHYDINVRTVKWKHPPAPWQKLAEFDFTGEGVDNVIQNACLVKPVFINIANQSTMSLQYVHSITLIRFERQPQDEGVVMKRWAGDTAYQYKTVELERRTLQLSDLQGGLMQLEPGLYQIKHNSASADSMGMTSGFYGESHFFEIRPGDEFIDVEVFLYPAI